MDEIVAALAEQQAELLGLLADLDEADWQRPSRCEGWTVADVVLHVAQTNEMAIASANGRFADYLNEVGRNVGPASDVDDGAALMVAAERGAPGSVVGDRYAAGASELRHVLATSDPHLRVEWVAGQLSARTLATTRLAETWIHTGDVAEALDIDLSPAPRLRHIARLAWRTIPYAFARAGRELHGPVAFSLRGPRGETWDFLPDDKALTTIRGDGAELCNVAARRVDPSATSLTGEGPDVDAVLELVRTYA
ncbi:MAG: hypothetical protein QOD92_3795 [Acidimicrobiaceae bacterium]